MEIVEALIYGEIGKQIGSLLISAIEPDECIVFVSQTRSVLPRQTTSGILTVPSWQSLALKLRY